MFCANLGAVLSSASALSPYWTATLFGTSANKSLTGNGIAIDSTGNILTTGVDYQTTTTTGAYVTKLSSAGAIVWQRKLTSGLFDPASPIFASFAAVDSADNVIATATDTTSTYIYVFKYDSAGNLLWQRRIPLATAIANWQWHSIAINSAGSIGIACVAGQASFIVTISSAGATLQQTNYGAIARINRTVKYTSTGDIILGGTEQNYPTVLRATAAGVNVWVRGFSGARTGQVEAIVLDSAENVYAVGYVNNVTNVYPQPMVLKYSSDGTLQWQKIIVVAEGISFVACDIDSAGLLYAVGYIPATPSYSILMCIDSTGAIVWQRKISSKVSATPPMLVLLTSISARSSGVLAIGSSVSYNLDANNCQSVVQYLSSTSPPVGTWGILTYESLSLTLSNMGFTTTVPALSPAGGTVTLTTPTIVSSVVAATAVRDAISSYPYKLTRLSGNVGTTEAPLQITGVVTDTLGNVYSVAYPTGAANTCVYIAKTNAAGQLVWQRRYLTGYAVGAPNILINPVEDTLYILLKASPPTVITYSTDGVLGLQRRLTSQNIPGGYGQKFAMDTAGDMYVIASSGANAEVLVSKLSSSLTLIYSKKVSGASGHTSATPVIAADQNGDFYCSVKDPGSNEVVIAKITTAGTVVAWQRFIKNSANGWNTLSMKLSPGGYLYVAAYETSAVDRIIIGKYDTATGAVVWQKQITGLTNVTGEFAFAFDSDDNCYAVTTVLPVSSIYYALLVKLDASGNQVWQRKLTGGTGVFSANSMCMYGDSTLIVGGQFTVPNGQGATRSGGYWTLNSDGTGLGTWDTVYAGAATEVGVPYATNAAPVAANIPISTVPTAVAISTYAYASTTPTNTSTTTTGNLSQLSEIV